VTRIQADGVERTTLNELDGIYRRARADAELTRPMALRWQCRRLQRRRHRLDWAGLAKLKAVREELAARGEEVPGWTT